MIEFSRSTNHLALSPFIVLLLNKQTTLAENSENLISAQPRISAHSKGPETQNVPRAVYRTTTVINIVEPYTAY